MIQELYDRIAELARIAVIQQWRAQGHELTGKAAREVEMVVATSAKGAKIDGYILDYMAELNEGTPANKIVYSKQQLRDLTRYVKMRGIAGSDRDASRIAWFIFSRHLKEGRPTKASARFSQTGKRTGFIDDALAEVEPKIAAILETAIPAAIETEIENFVKSRLNR